MRCNVSIDIKHNNIHGNYNREDRSYQPANKTDTELRQGSDEETLKKVSDSYCAYAAPQLSGINSKISTQKISADNTDYSQMTADDLRYYLINTSVINAKGVEKARFKKSEIPKLTDLFNQNPNLTIKLVNEKIVDKKGKEKPRFNPDDIAEIIKLAKKYPEQTDTLLDMKMKKKGVENPRFDTVRIRVLAPILKENPKAIDIADEMGVKNDAAEFLYETHKVLPTISDEIKTAREKYGIKNTDLVFQTYYPAQINGDDKNIRLKDTNNNVFKFNPETGKLTSVTHDNTATDVVHNRTSKVDMKIEFKDDTRAQYEATFGDKFSDKIFKNKTVPELIHKGFTPTETDILINTTNGEPISHEKFTESKIPGEYEIWSIAPNGKKYLTGLAENDANGGKHVEKHLVSLDGTTTDTVYANDADGNTFYHYEIKDKDGKSLYKSSKKRKNISDNHYQTFNNGVGYDVKINDKKIVVSKLDENNKKTKDSFEYVLRDFSEDEYEKLYEDVNEGVAIEKEDYNPDDTDENRTAARAFLRENNIKTYTVDRRLLPLVKKLSGEELAKLHDNETKCIIGKCPEAFNAYSSGGLIMVSDDFSDYETVLLHEAGHESFSKLGLANDKKFEKTYEKEKELFTNAFPDEMIAPIFYFLEGNEDGQATGRNETTAESNFLTNTYEEIPVFQARATILQQYFPKTIAYVANKISMQGRQE